MASVFLCHSSVDKPFARRLARDLVMQGVRVWLDEAELLVGDSLLAKIASAVNEMEYMVAVLSPHSVTSPWVQKELAMAMSTQLRANDVKVLPIVSTSCEIPQYLRDTFWLRMDKPTAYRKGLQNLIRRVQPNAFAAAPAPSLLDDPRERFSWVRNDKRRRQLRGKAGRVRIAALNGLKGVAVAVPISLELLGDLDDGVVAAALACLKEQPSSDGMLADLAGEDQYIPFGDDIVEGNTIVHYDLSESLAPVYDYLENNVLPQETLASLAATINSRHPGVRAISIFALIRARHQAVIPELLSASILEENDLIRELATWGLAELGVESNDTRVLNALLLAANDLVGNVRYQALKGLRRQGEGEALDAIVRSLGDPSDKIRKLAIEALGDLRTGKAFDALRRALVGRRDRSDYIADLFKAYVVRALAACEDVGVEGILISTMQADRYVTAFQRDERSAKYVVAQCLLALKTRGSAACLDVVRPLATITERVEIPTGLSGQGSYWVVEVGKAALAIIKAVGTHAT